MDSKEFSKLRRYLGKTQNQLAQLIGVSPKAIQSFEQGWRKVPGYTERQLLFLLFLKSSESPGSEPCWLIQNCPGEIRNNCPAWEFQAGNLCWFINGTVCKGIVQDSWPKKMKLCRQCEVFRSMLLPIEG